LAEALSCGTLTVGSDIDGYREVLDYQPFTRMVESKNSRDLAKQIAGFLDLPEEERQRLSRQASEYARRRFSWEVIAQKHVLYYEKKLGEHGRPNFKDWPTKRRHPQTSGVVFEKTAS
jgi:glycosyltransferase involved in cell wall biosynthesis